MREKLNEYLSAYGVGDVEGQWIAAVVVFFAALIIVYLIRSIVVWRVAKFAERSTTVWDDAAVESLRQTRWWFVLAFAVFCGSYMIELPGERTRDVLEAVMVLILLLQMAIWGHTLITAGAAGYVERRRPDDPAAAMTVSALAMIGKLVLFTILFLLALDNLGVDVTALIAGLGVGGIAVALAVQNILGDLLASLSIVFDKPFVPGDFIVVGDKSGTVRNIGLKTTRLQSLSGEQLVFSNNDLLQSRIQNFKLMSERRVVFSVGLTYDTPRSVLQQVPDLLRASVEEQENVRFDRAHFKSFGDFSLNFETVYYVLTPDYAAYMDIQQAINLSLHERIEQVGAEFAFPTQTLYVEDMRPDTKTNSTR